MHFLLHGFLPAAQVNAAQGADRGFENFRGEFFFLLQQDRGQQAAIRFGGRHFQNIGNFGPGIEQTFGERFGGEAEMQTLVLQDELGLAGGIEFFFCAVAGGKVFLGRLHLPGRGQGANENLFRRR